MFLVVAAIIGAIAAAVYGIYLFATRQNLNDNLKESQHVKDITADTSLTEVHNLAKSQEIVDKYESTNSRPLMIFACVVLTAVTGIGVAFKFSALALPAFGLSAVALLVVMIYNATRNEPKDVQIARKQVKDDYNAYFKNSEPFVLEVSNDDDISFDGAGG